jgi:hypothetical protein
MLLKFKKELRINQTDPENILWYYLRNRNFNGLKFRRQHILKGYIIDFVCLEKKVVIELDGGQHAEQKMYDLDSKKHPSPAVLCTSTSPTRGEVKKETDLPDASAACRGYCADLLLSCSECNFKVILIKKLMAKGNPSLGWQIKYFL